MSLPVSVSVSVSVSLCLSPALFCSFFLIPHLALRVCLCGCRVTFTPRLGALKAKEKLKAKLKAKTAEQVAKATEKAKKRAEKTEAARVQRRQTQRDQDARSRREAFDKREAAGETVFAGLLELMVNEAIENRRNALEDFVRVIDDSSTCH